MVQTRLADRSNKTEQVTEMTRFHCRERQQSDSVFCCLRGRHGNYTCIALIGGFSCECKATSCECDVPFRHLVLEFAKKCRIVKRYQDAVEECRSFVWCNSPNVVDPSKVEHQIQRVAIIERSLPCQNSAQEQPQQYLESSGNQPSRKSRPPKLCKYSNPPGIVDHKRLCDAFHESHYLWGAGGWVLWKNLLNPLRKYRVRA